MTAPRPEPRCEVAIEKVELTTIYFWATPDAADDFLEFGIIEHDSGGSNRYRIHVDRRYEVADVEAFMLDYDRQYRDLPEW